MQPSLDNWISLLPKKTLERYLSLSEIFLPQYDLHELHCPQKKNNVDVLKSAFVSAQKLLVENLGLGAALALFFLVSRDDDTESKILSKFLGF